MTPTDLADRTGLTVQMLNRIIRGEKPITCEVATKLGGVTDYTAQFWMNMEAQYRLANQRKGVV
jgi:HTH-type transcriptional regulator/antitoxin HigA